MNKFKVGDKVRRIDGEYAGMRSGDTGTVKEFDGNGFYIEEFPSRGSHDIGMFELVQRNESELERLVRVANEGYRAIEVLDSRFGKEIEIRSESCPGYFPWDQLSPATLGRHIRIKPKPTFEPFTVGSNWLVKLEGETLHIGCQRFHAKELKTALAALSKGAAAYESEHIEKITATRFGAGCVSGKIDWNEAEKILVALEKAGIK